MKAKITKRDQRLIREWLNCRVADVNEDGDVWVQGAMTGYWLNAEGKEKFIQWRKNYRRARKQSRI